MLPAIFTNSQTTSLREYETKKSGRFSQISRS